MSTVYDWRDGKLAPEADWPSLLAQVCTKPELRYTKTVLLQTTAKCTADELSSRYVRSLYQVCRRLLASALPRHSVVVRHLSFERVVSLLPRCTRRTT